MMQIGDLAARAGITTRTLRYYEELGIIEPDERSQGGFRLYSANQLRRLRLVQALKAIGFELERIRELFNTKYIAQTGGELAQSLIHHLAEQQRQIDSKIGYYLEVKERNQQAIEVLSTCLDCGVHVVDLESHNCAMYRQHPDVPEKLECKKSECTH